MPEVVALAAALADTGEDGVAAVVLGDVVGRAADRVAPGVELRAVEVADPLHQRGQAFVVLDLVRVDVRNVAQDLGRGCVIDAGRGRFIAAARVPAQQSAQRQPRVVVALVQREEGPVVCYRGVGVALLRADSPQEPVCAVGAAVLREQLERGLEMLGRFGPAPFPVQGLPERHAGHEPAWVAGDLGFQGGDIRDRERVVRRGHLAGVAAHRGHRRRKALVQEVLEVGVEVLQAHAQRAFERLLVGGAVPVGPQHGHDGREAVALLDQLEHQRRLVVAVAHLTRVARARKPLVQLADGAEFVRRQRPHEADARLMTPPGVGQALLVDRQPLGEPARHLAVRYADVEGVRDLVPQRRSPVEFAAATRRGRVNGERGPEAHAERSDPHQSDRSHGEVGVPRVDLDPDRLFRRVAVPRRHLRVRALGHGFHVRREQIGLGLVQHEAEVRRFDDPVFPKGVQQVECVLEPEVEGIAAERPLQVGPPDVDPSQTDLVKSHESPTAPAGWVGLARLSGEVQRVFVLAVVGGEFGQHDERRGGRVGQRAQPVHESAEPVVVAGEMEDRRLRTQGFQVRRVHVEHPVDLGEGVPPVPVHQAHAREERPDRREVGVRLERGFERCRGTAAALQPRDAGQSEQRFRVGGILGEHLLESIRGLPGVVALYKQGADRELGRVVEWAGRDGFVQGTQGVVSVLVVPAGQVNQGSPDRREFCSREAGGAVVVVDEAVEDGAGTDTVAVAVFEDPQFHPCKGARLPGLASPFLEHRPRVDDPSQVQQGSTVERPGARHASCHPSLGGPDRALVVAGLAERGYPARQRGAAATQRVGAERARGFVVTARAESGETVSFLGRDGGERSGRDRAGAQPEQRGQQDLPDRHMPHDRRQPGQAPAVRSRGLDHAQRCNGRPLVANVGALLRSVRPPAGRGCLVVVLRIVDQSHSRLAVFCLITILSCEHRCGALEAAALFSAGGSP